MLFRGDYRPAELYRGDSKISGYSPKTFSGQSISMEGTYNDKPVNIRINGGFTPSKNLLNPIFTERLWAASGSNQTITSDISGYATIIKAKPYTFYTVSGLCTGMNGSCMRIAQTSEYPAVGVTTLKRTDFMSATYANLCFQTLSNCNYLLCMTGTSSVYDYSSCQIQIEQKGSRTEYEPYKEPVYPVLNWNGEEIPIPHCLCIREDGTDYIEANASGATLYSYENGTPEAISLDDTELGEKLKELSNSPLLTSASVSLGTLDVTVNIPM